jgi:transcription elongation factor Elf1
MSLHECPRCGHETATNSTVAGPFETPPTLYCVHGEEAVEMDLVTDADVAEEAIVG